MNLMQIIEGKGFLAKDTPLYLDKDWNALRRIVERLPQAISALEYRIVATHEVFLPKAQKIGNSVFVKVLQDSLEKDKAACFALKQFIQDQKPTPAGQQENNKGWIS